MWIVLYFVLCTLLCSGVLTMQMDIWDFIDVGDAICALMAFVPVINIILLVKLADYYFDNVRHKIIFRKKKLDKK